MSYIKTKTGENIITFDAFYQYIWARNYGDTDVYISNHSDIVAGDDDVALLPAGEAVRLTVNGKTLYVLGSTTLEVHAQNFSDAPFAWNEAGEGGGSDITVVSLSVNDNGTYTAPSGTAYSPVTVNVSPNVGTKSITDNGTYTASTDNLDGYSSVTVNVPSGIGYIEQIEYVQTSDSGTAGFSLSLQQGDIIHLDMQILRLNGEPCIIGNGDYGTEVYLDGGTPKEYGTGISWTQDMDTSNVSIGERRMYKALFGLTTIANVMFYRKNSPTYSTYGNIYGINVYRNGVEIMNIVPARIHGIEKGFMYDTINHIFYYSTMDADFTPPTND